jgi:hypothetical protein
MMTLQDIMKALRAAGFENCHFDGQDQIIVNNRGEIELFDFNSATIHNRLVKNGPRLEYKTLESLMEEVKKTWAAKEPLTW